MDQVLTPHFTFEELTKVGPHQGIDNTPPTAIAGNLLKIAEKLEAAREIWGVPVNVSYGFRCLELNAAVGGSETSAHLYGLAADAIPEGMDMRHAWDMLVAYPGFCADVDQLIIERGCVHIGLPTERHGFVPRHELRLDADENGVRVYPLFGHWTPTGVDRA